MKKKIILGCLGFIFSLIIIFVIIVVVVIVMYFRNINQGIAAHEARIDQKLSQIRSSLAKGTKPDSKKVAELAGDPDVRNTLYQDLKKHHVEDLFPPAFRTIQAYAEANLVHWLCHPNELQQPPDEIEFMKVVSVDSKTTLGEVDYYLFRFRVKKPHWAAEDGWMAGVSGPYIKNQPLEKQIPDATYSEFEGYSKKSPEDHVKYFHNMAIDREVYSNIESRLK